MSNPSLLCVPYRFKTSTLYSQIPDSGLGDFVVTRSASNSATRVNAQGFIETVADNVPRLDYPLGGITAGCPALLVEPSAQNTCLQSSDFNTTWLAQNSATVNTNTAISPDGTQNADTINLAAVNDSRVRQTITVANSTTYTISCFYKNIALTAGQTFRMRFNNALLAPNNFIAAAVIDLAAGTATYSLIGTSGTGFSGTATGRVDNYGNGWYRVSVTFTVGTGGGAAGIFEAASIDPGAVRSFYAWGAQLETGSVATSYIPTTTGSVTRNADVISVSGAVSGSIGQTEGTIYLETNKLMDATLERFLSIYSSTSPTNDNIIISKTTSNTINFGIRKNNVLSTYVANFSGTVFKFACAFNTASGGVAIYVNGTQLLIDTNSGSFASVLNEVYIGRLRPSVNTDNLYNGRIRAAALYTTRLSNAQLQSLTQ